MSFIIDGQTFADLEIFEGDGANRAAFKLFNDEANKSVFKLFNRVLSHGGKKHLLDLFQNPLSDIKKTQERQELISYAYKEQLSVTIDPFWLDFIESYFLLSDKPVTVSRLNAWRKALKDRFKPTNEYYLIQRGIGYVIEVLQKLHSFITEKSKQKLPFLLEQQFNFILESVRDTELSKIIGVNPKKKIKPMDLERFDYIFRYHEYERLNKILQILYQIDTFQAVANTAIELGLVFPEISESKAIEITGLYHPFVKDAVANDIRLDEEGNMFFLTGANMAGKSTFLKAFGIAVYFAHLGFPVAAASMRTGVFSGLFSTINIADNITKGHSHFYSEVLRIKSVAKEIAQTGNLVVIFDELFRGTNVKDAYDASLAIISALAEVKGSAFLVSTHIMELAEPLCKIKNIRFGYFHTTIENKTAIYSYQLRSGVTEERLGMLIIENERIVEMINAGSKAKI